MFEHSLFAVTLLSFVAGNVAEARSQELYATQPSERNLAAASITPSPAVGSGSWSGQIGGPALYNTNLLVASGQITPPAGLPNTATTTSVLFT